MSKIYIVYHKVDSDGYCSAALVWHGHATVKAQDRVLVPFNYGDDVTEALAHAGEGDVVWVVDCCLAPDQMKELAERTRLIWCDHHVTAIKAMADAKVGVEGFQEIGKSGCELVHAYITYEWKNAGACAWGKDVSRLVGRYDVWDHSDPDVVPFQYGLRACAWASNPASEGWYLALKGDGLEEIRAEGEAILSYVAEQNKRLSGQAFKGTLAGRSALFINGGGGSTIFDYAPAKDHVEVLCHFFMDKDGKWRCTLFQGGLGKANDLDVSTIAKSFGGGGHKGAAGFESPGLTFINSL